MGVPDPELAAIVANCSAIEEEAEDPEPPPKKMNRDFFNILTKTGTTEIRRTSFRF